MSSFLFRACVVLATLVPAGAHSCPTFLGYWQVCLLKLLQPGISVLTSLMKCLALSWKLSGRMTLIFDANRIPARKEG